MATNITQIEDDERGKTILRVTGEMRGEDAILLEKIALDLRSELGRNLTLDLADLHFLDSDGAAVLKRVKDKHAFEIEGLEIFLQTVVTEAENKIPKKDF